MIYRAARHGSHDHHHLILGKFARHRDRGGFAHVGMRAHLDLDLERRDVLAAAANRVLHAVDEIEIAVLVAAEGVAGVEPAIRPGLGGGLRVAVVAAVHRPGAIGADQHLADRADRHLAIVAIDQPHLDMRPHLSTGAALDRIGLRHDRRGNLGHVEDRVDVDPEAFGEGRRVVGERHHEGGAHAVVTVFRAGRALHQEGRHHP